MTSSALLGKCSFIKPEISPLSCHQISASSGRGVDCSWGTASSDEAV